jgi:hypothetical protein
MNEEEKAHMKRERQRLYNKRHYEKNKGARQERNKAYYAKLKACCEGGVRPPEGNTRPPLANKENTRPPINPPYPPLVDYSSDEDDDKPIPVIANKKQKKKPLIVYDDSDDDDDKEDISDVTAAVIAYLTNRKLPNGNPVAQNTVRIDLNSVRLMQANCSQSIEHCMKNIGEIEDMTKNWGISKRQTFFRTFNLIGDWMFKHGLISKKTKDDYAKFNKVTSLQNRDNQEKNKDKEYPSFTEYMANLTTKYPPDSNVYLLAKLYEENSGVRDAYSNANVYDKLKPEWEIDENGNKKYDEENYFIIKRTGPCQFVLNKHKTSDHERFVFSYSAPVSKLLREYMKANKVQYGQPLFSGVSSLFSKVNKSLGYKIAGTNAFRHMIITELLSKENLTAAQRVEIADRFFHSPEMSKIYVRKLIKNMGDAAPRSK